MPGIMLNFAKRYLLNQRLEVLEGGFLFDMELHLFTNNIVPSPGDSWTTYVEVNPAVSIGYVPFNLAGVHWTAAVIVGPLAFTQRLPGQVLRNNGGVNWETVYGWWIDAPGPTRPVVAADLFPSPITLVPTQLLPLNPELFGKSEF